MLFFYLFNTLERLEQRQKIKKFVSLNETQIKNLAKKYKPKKTTLLSEQTSYDQNYQYNQGPNNGEDYYNTQFENSMNIKF